MIKNVIFDLGNVLLNFKPKEFLLQYTDDLKHIDSFVLKVTSSDTWLKLDRGIETVDNVKNFLIARYPEEKELLIPFFDHWMEMLAPIKSSVEILIKLKQNGYKLFVLSNFIREAFDFITNKHDFLSLFDGKVISFEEKMIKPEKEVYDILLNRYKLLPEECVFIDDHLNFLTPAKQLGMKTILFRPNTDLQEELRKLNVKI